MARKRNTPQEYMKNNWIRICGPITLWICLCVVSILLSSCCISRKNNDGYVKIDFLNFDARATNIINSSYTYSYLNLKLTNKIKSKVKIEDHELRWLLCGVKLLDEHGRSLQINVIDNQYYVVNGYHPPEHTITKSGILITNLVLQTRIIPISYVNENEFRQKPDIRDLKKFKYSGVDSFQDKISGKRLQVLCTGECEVIW